MTLEELIPAVLNSLVEKRVWELSTPDDLPRNDAGTILPFILFWQAGGQDSEYVDQTMPDKSHARVQIECYAPSSAVKALLMQQARDTLLASSYTVGVLGSPIGTYDATRKLRGSKQQFSIWFRQTA